MNQSQIDELYKLKELFDAGILTQEEMQAQKNKILSESQESTHDELKKEVEEHVDNLTTTKEAAEIKPSMDDFSKSKPEDKFNWKPLLITSTIFIIIIFIIFLVIGTSPSSDIQDKHTNLYNETEKEYDITDSRYNDHENSEYNYEKANYDRDNFDRNYEQYDNQYRNNELEQSSQPISPQDRGAGRGVGTATVNSSYNTTGREPRRVGGRY